MSRIGIMVCDACNKNIKNTAAPRLRHGNLVLCSTCHSRSFNPLGQTVLLLREAVRQFAYIDSQCWDPESHAKLGIFQKLSHEIVQQLWSEKRKPIIQLVCTFSYAMNLTSV